MKSALDFEAVFLQKIQLLSLSIINSFDLNETDAMTLPHVE